MTATSDLIKVVGGLLRPVGFKKAGSTWRLITDDVIVVLNIQKSQFDSAHFVNIGFWIRSLGDDMKPKPELCHVRGRAERIWPDLGSQLVELMNIPDTDVLDESRAEAIQEMFRGRIVPLLEKGASTQGLSELVAECDGLQVRRVACPSSASQMSNLCIPIPERDRRTLFSAKPRPAPRASLRKRRSASQPRWDIWLILLGTLLVWAFCVGMFLRQERYRVTTTPIAQMQLGANVPGVNPGEADDLSLGETIDPATWRKVSLTGRQTDGSLLEIELLRPLAWVDAHRIDGSDRLLLHMGELDFHGEAQLTSIEPCPPVRAGPGRTVTGLFRHHAHDVLNLYTTDGFTET